MNKFETPTELVSGLTKAANNYAEYMRSTFDAITNSFSKLKPQSPSKRELNLNEKALEGALDAMAKASHAVIV